MSDKPRFMCLPVNGFRIVSMHVDAYPVMFYAHLTPEQCRELAGMLTDAAQQVEQRQGQSSAEGLG